MTSDEHELPDSDQKLADADQRRSDDDQARADAEQLASDRDQAASDHVLACGGDPLTHARSRKIRRRGTRERQQAALVRLHAAGQRGAISRERDRLVVNRPSGAREISRLKIVTSTVDEPAEER